MNKNLRKLTGIVTTGAMVLTLGVGALSLNNTSVFASEVDQNEVTQTRPANLDRQGVKGGQRIMNSEQGGLRENKMSKDNMMKKNQNKMLDFNQLEEAGLLDASQVEAIQTFVEAQKAEMEAQREVVKDMTVEERQAYFEEKKAEEKPSLMDTLVDENIITTSEAEAIELYLQSAREEAMTSKMNEELSTLITDGTLTQENVNSIIEFLVANKPEEKVRPVQGELTGEKSERVSPFDLMVEQSIITEEQADAIEALHMQGHQGKRVNQL